MSPPKFAIDDRLKHDSLLLLEHQHCQLRLNKNATIPWAIIIPETDVVEYHELSQEMQFTITHLAAHISQIFKSEHGAEKINFAAIGNVVSQLHVHVVGRHANDPLCPDVVWGQALPEASYSTSDIEHLKARLKQALDTS